MSTARNLPSAIACYLVTLATQQRNLAYLQVSPTGHILSSGGMLTKYSLGTARVGDAIDQHLLFLAGFFPHPPEDEVIQYVQTEQGHVIDVHFITSAHTRTSEQAAHPTGLATIPLAATPAASTEQWILLLDATEKIKKEQQFQQIANDLTLARQQLTKQIDQAHHQSPSLSPPSASTHAIDTQLISRLLNQSNRTEVNSTEASSIEASENPIAKQISVLIIQVCQSSVRLTQLNDYLAEITQLVSEENGLVHHVFGPTAVALFGLLPTSLSPAVQATRTAKRLIYRLTPQLSGPHTTVHTAAKTPQYPVAIAITTGDASIGTISHANRQTINVDGPVIATTVAMRNLSQAGSLKGLYPESYPPHFPHTLVVDDLTLHSCNTELSAFNRHRLPHDHPPPLYQLIPK